MAAGEIVAVIGGGMAAATTIVAGLSNGAEHGHVKRGVGARNIGTLEFAPMTIGTKAALGFFAVRLGGGVLCQTSEGHILAESLFFGVTGLAVFHT
jgi:hypothetical protein